MILNNTRRSCRMSMNSSLFYFVFSSCFLVTHLQCLYYSYFLRIHFLIEIWFCHVTYKNDKNIHKTPSNNLYVHLIKNKQPNTENINPFSRRNNLIFYWFHTKVSAMLCRNALWYAFNNNILFCYIYSSVWFIKLHNIM